MHPAQTNAAFEAAMEDVLEAYQRSPDDNRSLVCPDEFAKQLLYESRLPIPDTRRHVARHDYEYVREGSVSGFILAMPHLGDRNVFVGEDGRRNTKDFAACLERKNENLRPINWQFTNEKPESNSSHSTRQSEHY